jgi:hypothetical protein
MDQNSDGSVAAMQKYMDNVSKDTEGETSQVKGAIKVAKASKTLLKDLNDEAISQKKSMKAAQKEIKKYNGEFNRQFSQN